MAGKNREKKHNLVQGLKKEAYKYDFFHALRLIECCHDDQPLIGRAKRPTDEAVRLGQKAMMSFESSTLTEFLPPVNGEPARLNQRFLGLFGPNGPMPLHLTEYVCNREHNFHDHTLARFADIFHHRMISLFYRTRADAEPAFSFDRPNEDRFSGYIAALSGFAGDSLENRDAMPDLAKLYYTGRLSCQTANAEGLVAILQDFFRLSVRIDEFIGEWLNIERNDLTCLGGFSASGRLGVSTVLGSKVWSCQHKFRIVLGPLKLKQYMSLLPGGSRLQTLIAMVRNYVGYEYNWDINLILHSREVPMMRLDGKSRLGWCSWLGYRKIKENAADVLLNPIRKC